LILEKSLASSDAEISNLQQSFDLRVEHFTLLVQQLATYSDYAPNETDLKVTALNTWLNNLKTLNTAVISATTPLSNARIARNKILYNPSTGLVAIANDVKPKFRSRKYLSWNLNSLNLQNSYQHCVSKNFF